MRKNLEKEKELAAREAVKFICDKQVVGLGTGSTAVYAIRQIAQLVKNGLQIKAVATSVQTGLLAASMHIPVIDINSVHSVDITIDGADEFTSALMLIKGGGGALLREKIVASMTREEIIIADSSKKVDKLGKFKLPIEVIPFACGYVLDQLSTINGRGIIRRVKKQPFTTDSGNYILDADFGIIENPLQLSTILNQLEGVVAHGLFINLASKVIMGNDDIVITFDRNVSV